MRLLTTVAALRCYLGLHRSGEELGFVPTMGALHEGHLSLIRQACRENDRVAVSIFVNPLQFGPNEDLDRYPRTLERDRQLCEQLGVDALFAPDVAQMYPDGAQGTEALTQVVPPPEMTAVLCGRTRPGHFQGVATVVTKLLNLVRPDRAYFGQKDAQQLAIIRRLVADLNLPVEIVAGAIVREPSGLALSSRNQYLTPEQRQKAAALYRSLRQARIRFEKGDRTRDGILEAIATELESVPELQIEYVELVHPDSLMPLKKVETSGLLALAARIGSTRLIDNIVLHNRQPIIAIDGPAGAGKSTVARQVARNLGLLYLDTGAMYRAVTWLALQAGATLDDEPAVAEVLSRCQLELQPTQDEAVAGCQVKVNGEDVTQAIRTGEVTSNVSTVAAQSAVRQFLVQQQQNYGSRGGLVAEGRDIGTHVFPHAELKIFLTASVRERARRRRQDLERQGQNVMSLDRLEQAIAERDRKDSTRVLAPLCKAPEAIEIQTDGLSISDVIGKIVDCYHEKMAEMPTLSRS